jgi:CheY-like chemotaxis protein
MNAQRRILIAAPAPVIAELGGALEMDVEVVGAETWDEALERLREASPSLIVVCYAFDEMRPFRLIHHIERMEPEGGEPPVFLVRALPVPLGTTEEGQIRDSYGSLGVVEFIDLCKAADKVGRAAALRRFAAAVSARVVASPSAGGPAPRVR